MWEGSMEDERGRRGQVDTRILAIPLMGERFGTPEVSQKTEDFRSWRVEDRGEQEWVVQGWAHSKEGLSDWEGGQNHTGPHNEEPSRFPDLAWACSKTS